MNKKITTLKIVIAMAIIAIITAILCGCGETTVQVENMLKLEQSFSGTRTITCNFGTQVNGNDQQKQELDSVIADACPSSLTYENISDDSGYKYIFTISFNSLTDYKKKIENVIGKQVNPALATPNSDLARGWRLREDFDGMDLVQWLKTGIKEKGYKDLNTTFNSTSNVVNYGGDIVSSKDSVIAIDAVEGFPVNSISMETTNNKSDSYDRKIILSVPQSTFDKMGAKLNTIMEARTDATAVYSGWSQQGNYQEYQVLYQGINLKDLQRVTNLFMDNNSADIYYGDENHSSTPLAEQLVFEENIDILSFIPQEGKSVSLNYKYSLPIKTTHGQGVVLRNGVWEKEGEWVDGVYTLQSTDSVYDMRIPDGMQYAISGINVSLTAYDNNNFTRTFDFIYDKQAGEDGMNYAYNFLTKKGINAAKDKTDTSLICRITQSGTAQEISNQVGDLFGGGNYMSYSSQTSAMAVVTDIAVEDNINITYMLTGSNINVPFTYTVHSGGNENISDMTGENQAVKETPKIISNKDGSFTAKMVGGENNITFAATVPYSPGVTTYCIVAGVMLLLAGLLILLFINKTKKINARERQQLLIEERIAQEKEATKADYDDNF